MRRFTRGEYVRACTTAAVVAPAFLARPYRSPEHYPWGAKARVLALVASVPLMQVMAGVMNLALIALIEGPGGPSVSILRDAVSRLLQGT